MATKRGSRTGGGPGTNQYGIKGASKAASERAARDRSMRFAEKVGQPGEPGSPYLTAGDLDMRDWADTFREHAPDASTEVAANYLHTYLRPEIAGQWAATGADPDYAIELIENEIPAPEHIVFDGGTPPAEELVALEEAAARTGSTWRASTMNGSGNVTYFACEDCNDLVVVDADYGQPEFIRWSRQGGETSCACRSL